MKKVSYWVMAMSLLIGWFGLSEANAHEYKVGETYHGFLLVKSQPIMEANSQGLLFEHKKSGARLLKLLTDDDNRSFSISFRTPANSDTGEPHILEHSVLNGSRKFPVKSPFEILAQGSLNTFLNAMTAEDFTMYPVASTNDQDFINLMDVYLDAVLYPRIYVEPKIFQQEGWHYEMDNPDGELSINGIVYNEMKGVYSSPDQALDYVISKALFPSSPYGYSSGGHPDHIPELTGEKLNAFHKKHYHPSNSYITLWGDGDTLSELQFIDSKYLSAFTRTKVDTAIAVQKSFSKRKEVVVDCPIGKNEEIADKTLLSWNWVVGGAAQPGLSMSMAVLADVLVNLPAAPLRKALVKAKIGKDVYASYANLKQGVFAISVSNANPADQPRFEKIVEETLGRVIAEGLDKKAIEGVINKKSFQLREADFGSFPKGLVYTYMGQRGWMFADDPFLTIAYEAPLAEVRKALTSQLLEGLIQKHLLDNPHSVLGMAKPKPGLEDEYSKALTDKLAKRKAEMSHKQRLAIVQQTQALKAYQAEKDKPEDIAKIPMVSLSDLKPQARKVEGQIRDLNGTQVLHFEHQTNGIIYFSVLFDATVVPKELIQYLPLLAEVLGQLNTKNFSYGEFDTEKNIHTGGLNFWVDTFQRDDQREIYQPNLTASAKVLTPKFQKLIELLNEIVKNTRFDDRQRLAEVIAKHSSHLEGMARGAGSNLASKRLSSYLSPAGQYTELTGGLSYIQFVAELAKSFEKNPSDIIADLAMVASLVFNRNNLIIGVTCNQADYAEFEKHAPALIAALDAQAQKAQVYTFVAPTQNEGLLAASKVQYVNQGANFRNLGFEYTGQLKVLSQTLSRVYLTDKIRVQGGAYGAWAIFSRNGLTMFASYRDPNLGETLEVFAGLPKYLSEFNASDREMTRFIIGTIARLDLPQTPAKLGYQALSDYLCGITYADHQKERDAVLTTSQTDIQKLSPLVKAVLDRGRLCVYGNEKILRKNEKLFDTLVEVID